MVKASCVCDRAQWLKRRTVPVQRIVADEEELLNVIKPNSQDAIVSCMNLHWINDLPGQSLCCACVSMLT
jgi:hypothetical protein